MIDIFAYLLKQNLNNIEILNFLKYEKFTKALEIHKHDHEVSMTGLRNRSIDDKKYNNYICIYDFIQQTYNKKLLSYSHHSHPTPTYYQFIINEILKKLNIDSIDLLNFDFIHGGSSNFVSPTQFRFFNDIFQIYNHSQILKLNNSVNLT